MIYLIEKVFITLFQVASVQVYLYWCYLFIISQFLSRENKSINIYV